MDTVLGNGLFAFSVILALFLLWKKEASRAYTSLLFFVSGFSASFIFFSLPNYPTDDDLILCEMLFVALLITAFSLRHLCLLLLHPRA